MSKLRNRVVIARHRVTERINKSTFVISKMDCPSEEKLVRLALEGVSDILHLEFDLQNRTLNLYHEGPPAQFVDLIGELNLGANLTDTTETERPNIESFDVDDKNETRILRILQRKRAAIYRWRWHLELEERFLENPFSEVSQSRII